MYTVVIPWSDGFGRCGAPAGFAVLAGGRFGELAGAPLFLKPIGL